MNTDKKKIRWFTYFSVENNDYRLVDHEKYSTYISLVAKYINPKHLSIQSETVKGNKEVFNIKSN